MVALKQIERHKTIPVQVGNVTMGGDNPVIIQSMTNTDTADIERSFEQVRDLYIAGSEIVRLTVNNEAAAAAIPKINEKLLEAGFNIPMAGCFHYNGHELLSKYPECAKTLAKYRINPGNLGFGKNRDSNFETLINIAIKYDKPIRIGVNWGSLDQKMIVKLMNENAKLDNPKPSDYIMREALVMSALTSAEKAVELGLGKDKIILSAKVSRVQDLYAVYEELSNRSNYALHLGLTEAGMGSKGIVASTAALSYLLQSGIGDTIRVSLTPQIGEPRTKEVEICQQILQSLNLRQFTPEVAACPGCGRTTSSYFQELASDIEKHIKIQMNNWKENHPGVESMKVAVMGCIVNGPGESKHANIGISLPGTGEKPVAPVFTNGKKTHTLRGDNIANEFKELLDNYVIDNYSKTN